MRRRRSIGLLAIILAAALLPSCDRGTGPEAGPRGVAGATRAGVSEVGPGDAGAADARTIYVPAYSHVATADDARPYNLAVTLSVRNTDRDAPIVVRSVRYIDMDGKPVRDYLKAPVRLAPLAAIDFFVKESDTAGGSSACFLVDWSPGRAASEPLVEAVMAGTAGTQGISFTATGRPLPLRAPRLDAPDKPGPEGRQ